MPYVNVKITREGVTREQKQQLVAGITQLLVDILGKRPDRTHIVIEEIDLENWGFDGKLTDELRKREQQQA